MTAMKRPRLLTVPALVILVGGITGCAHVKQEDLNSQLATLRQDLTERMDQGDRQTRDQLGVLASRVDALQADLNALEQDFDVTVERLETAIRFDVPVYFAFDEASLQPEGRQVLERFADVAGTYYPQATITVEGFTDPAGSAAYNRRLGAARAESVKAYLVDQGLTGDRIRTVSYGEDTARLIAKGQQGPGTDGWQNRRVVLVIDHSGPTSAAVAQQGASS